ncbi:virulence-associated E family protein [Lyngbya sp. CCY1209]|uniref:virulence-associated E family protein n=1 Tax=Lyngbya sp. CCY1209 TaxID=2886103 RepID=UPI002D211D8E|nr:virulence-associated E family protein [Lyngbya sp. CCY1209]MEB3886129.1 virulence-associated E family protein [Lyngbya sp. CCY1209]
MDMECPEMELAERFNIEMKGTERQKDAIILAIAKKNSHHPFQKYLLECNQKHKDTRILEGIAERYFGTNDPIHQEYVKRFLIAIVARVMRPGCKHDTAFILQGPQGWKKSTWFRKLVGDPNFCDDMGDYTNKDELLKFLTHVLTEWAELETQIGRKQVSQLKAFLATETFSVRPPYARRSSEFSVRGVIAGSTNESEFLTDSTGNRRFWVVPVLKPIPIPLLESERDRIFGAAVELFLQGERWWLTPEEQKLSDLANQQFTELSVLEQYVADYLDGKTEATTIEILSYLKEQEIPVSFGDTAKMAGPYIRKAAEKAGWKPDRFYRGGKWVRGYKCPQLISTNDPSIHQRSINGSAMDRPETPLRQMVQDNDPSDPSKTADSVNLKNDRADTPDRTDTPQSEPTRSRSDDPSTVGGDRAGDTPHLISRTSHDEYVKAFQEIFKDLAGQGKKRIGRKQLLLRFKKPGDAEAVLKELIDIWRLQEINGYIYPVPPTKRRDWFSVGKEVVIIKDGDKLKGIIGEITEVVNERTVRLTAEHQSFQYPVKDLKPRSS